MSRYAIKREDSSGRYCRRVEGSFVGAHVCFILPLSFARVFRAKEQRRVTIAESGVSFFSSLLSSPFSFYQLFLPFPCFPPWKIPPHGIELRGTRRSAKEENDPEQACRWQRTPVTGRRGCFPPSSRERTPGFPSCTVVIRFSRATRTRYKRRRR